MTCNSAVLASVNLWLCHPNKKSPPRLPQSGSKENGEALMGFQYPGPEVTITSIHISLSRTAHGALAKGKGLRNAELHALQGKENQELISIGSGHRTCRGRPSSWQSLMDGETWKRIQDVRRASQSRCICGSPVSPPMTHCFDNCKECQTWTQEGKREFSFFFRFHSSNYAASFLCQGHEHKSELPKELQEEFSFQTLNV